MKKILFFLVCFIVSVSGYSQFVNTVTQGSATTLGNDKGGRIADSALIVLGKQSFADTTAANYSVASKYKGVIIYTTNGSGNYWIRQLLPNKWVEFTTGNSGIYVKYTDTAAMLAPYLRTSDTTYMLSTRVKYSDTANQMSGYLRKNWAVLYTDTASMLSQLLRISDTANMLDPYVRNDITINTNAPLFGGGDLSTDRTFGIDTGRSTAQIPTGGDLNQVRDSLVGLISGGGFGTVLSVSTTDGVGIISSVANPTSTPNISLRVDTLAVSTRLWRQKGIDSVMGQVSLKVNISDTSNMLDPYLRKTDTATMLSSFVQYSDTAYMLSNRLKISDTAYMLSNRLKISDTTYMLSNRLKISDTTTMLARGWLSNRSADSILVLRTLINTKGTGTVTSVGFIAPSFLTITNSPITTSGNIVATLANQTANTVFSGPTTGSAAQPTFRALVAADLPDSYLPISDTASMLSNRLKISDTATMLNGYARNGQVVKYSDTTSNGNASKIVAYDNAGGFKMSSTLTMKSGAEIQMTNSTNTNTGRIKGVSNGGGTAAELALTGGDNTGGILINNAGKVGINNTAPIQQLQVTGSVNVSDSLYTPNLTAQSTASNKFVVVDNGYQQTRTAAQVRSDIGAGTGSGTLTSITVASGITSTVNPIVSTGTIQVDTSVIATSVRIPFKTAEQLGAVGDGITDDAAKIQAGLDAGYAVYLSRKVYKIGTVLNIPDKGMLIGLGDSSVLRVSGSTIGVNVISGTNQTVQNLRIVGNVNTTVGIQISGDVGNPIIDKVYFDSLYQGLYIGNSYTNQHEKLISNCVATNCTYGYYNDTRGEYTNYSNCVANSNTQYGWYNGAGNNNWIGGGIDFNTVGGIWLNKGSNDGHGVINGASINHNGTYSIFSDSVRLGYNISNCQIYYGKIYVKNSLNIKFENNDIYAPDSVLFNNSTQIELTDNKFIVTPTKIDTAYLASSSVKWFNNLFVDNTANTPYNLLYGDLNLRGTLTASIPALSSTASTFLTNTSGLIQSRTITQTYTDLGVLPLTAGSSFPLTGDLYMSGSRLIRASGSGITTSQNILFDGDIVSIIDNGHTKGLDINVNTGAVTNFGSFSTTGTITGIGTGITGVASGLSIGGTAASETLSTVTGRGATTNIPITISTPSSGIALTTNGVSGNWTNKIQGNTTASNSFGLIINAGTNSSDNTLLINNAANTINYFGILGDGSSTTYGKSFTAGVITGSRLIGNSGTDNTIDAIQSGGGSILGNLYRSEGKIQATSATIDATATVWEDNTNGSTVTYTLPNTSSLQGGHYYFVKTGTGNLTLSGTIVKKDGTSAGGSMTIASTDGLTHFWFSGSTYRQVN